ncbi:ABC transporter substrate-binding protein [Tessaracoccus oleiagri]|uniref:Raffinose/stachyose/melibiose transport system substrate-binding protein n=1 Tax=Tessaracoccus oleiagri TaxID=686624 RepID=A0A1G9KLD6_9ACTN|nr:ABC transporter substrate-binding protein [Tessaracoccus oleiagri]SDL50205.1 raffinose/stachyose/melibiose transport system substrate-binding protein [Tessaracoccus oleiagri]
MLASSRRRVAVLTVAALSTGFLAACSDSNAQETNEPAPAPASSAELGGTLTIATSSDIGPKLFIDDFTAETGVDVKGTYAEAGALGEQIRIQVTSGTAPDLFRSAPGYAAPSSVLNLAEEGALMDLSDQPWAEFVPESFAPLQQLDDKTYAFPTYGQAMLAFYNKAVFEEVGVEPPTTWPEFIEVMDQLKAAGKTPIALGLADAYIMQFLPFALSSTLVNGQTPDFYDRLNAGETSFVESEGWRKTLELFLGLIEDGYTTPNPLGMPGDPAMQSVGSGEAAIVVMPSAASPVLAGFMEGGADQMGSFAIPATDDASETFVAFTPDYLVVNADAENADAALAFLDYISAPERTAEWAAEMGAIPALTNAEPIDNPLNQTVQPFLDEGRTAPFANHAWPGGQVAAALMEVGQQAVEGSKTIDDVLAAMDAAYQEAMK